MDRFMQGIFAGGLIICLLMLNFDKPRQCVVEFGRDNVTHVLVGKYNDD